jgi:glycolate oxidase
MDVLPEIADALKGRAKIMIDGGFCRGTDVVKALAAGADLVGLGRMQCYALAAAGQGGLVRMLELLEDETQRSLGLAGATRLSELDRTGLHPAQPVGLPHVLSAFPLLHIDDYRY